MLQNAYFLAKIGADTAENERHFAKILPKTGNYPTGPERPEAAAQTSTARFSTDHRGGLRDSVTGTDLRKIGEISKILQIFCGLVLGCIKTKFCKKICV